MSERVLVHADGGQCHGTPLVDGLCPRCGIAPDSQSTELWPVSSKMQESAQPERPLPDVTLLLLLAQLWGRGVNASIHWDTPVMEVGGQHPCRAITVRVREEQLEGWRAMRVASTGNGSALVLEGWEQFAEATAISWGEIWQGIRTAVPESVVEDTHSKIRLHLDKLLNEIRALHLNDHYSVSLKWIEELRSLVG
jgi:hypothetical protein